MYVITSNHVYTTMAVQDWQPVIDQLQKTLKKIKAPLNEDETDGGMNAVAALVQANGKACLTIGMGATHSQIKDILDSLDIFASSPDYTQTEVNFTASTQMQTVNTYTYNINVGFLLPIVWEHLQGLEAELKKKNRDPTNRGCTIREMGCLQAGARHIGYNARPPQGPRLPPGLYLTQHALHR